MITLQRTSTDTFSLTDNGITRDYPITKLHPQFVEWNLGQRTFVLRKMLEKIENGEEGHHHSGGGGFGAHLPVYITHNPKEKLFPMNAANKGTGFVAKDEFLDGYIELFQKINKETALSDSAPQDEQREARKKRIKTILQFYETTEKIDLRVLAGLEIWPGQTSKNFTTDPRVSLHFLGMPTPGQELKYNQWQVNCIWERIEEDDKRFQFGVALRQLTLGHVGKSFVPGHIPVEQTPIKGHHPFGWNLWVIETLDKGIAPLHS